MANKEPKPYLEYLFPGKKKKTKSKRQHWYYFVFLLVSLVWVWLGIWILSSLDWHWRIGSIIPGIFLAIISLYGIIRKISFSNLNILLRIITILVVVISLAWIVFILWFSATINQINF